MHVCCNSTCVSTQDVLSAFAGVSLVTEVCRTGNGSVPPGSTRPWHQPSVAAAISRRCACGRDPLTSSHPTTARHASLDRILKDRLKISVFLVGEFQYVYRRLSGVMLVPVHEIFSAIVKEVRNCGRPIHSYSWLFVVFGSSANTYGVCILIVKTPIQLPQTSFPQRNSILAIGNGAMRKSRKIIVIRSTQISSFETNVRTCTS